MASLFENDRSQLLTDVDMHLLIEKGLRGGIYMISNRYAKTNNPYLPNFNSHTPSNYIMYLDANNLYGWVMSQYLPTHGFCWTDSVDVTVVSDNADEGYILEVDLEYPTPIHDLHSDYPLAPESLTVTADMLSRTVIN